MSEHILEYLNAYHDGELNKNQARKVALHLEKCLICQEANQDLMAISASLADMPMPVLVSPEKMAADIALLLPREQDAPAQNRWMRIGWWLFPILLLTAWIILGSTNLLVNLLTSANQFGFISFDANFLTYQSLNEIITSSLLNRMKIFLPDDLTWFINADVYLRYIITNTFLHVSIAILYLSWIAIWWANQIHQRNGQSLNR